MTSTVASNYIELDAEGRAWIAGANTKVIEVVCDKLAHGSSSEEIHFQYPHLSLARYTRHWPTTMITRKRLMLRSFAR